MITEKMDLKGWKEEKTRLSGEIKTRLADLEQAKKAFDRAKKSLDKERANLKSKKIAFSSINKKVKLIETMIKTLESFEAPKKKTSAKTAKSKNLAVRA